LKGCQFLHEAVEADQSGNISLAKEKYASALKIFDPTSPKMMEELENLMVGNADDAVSLVQRAFDRLQALDGSENTDQAIGIHKEQNDNLNDLCAENLPVIPQVHSLKSKADLLQPEACIGEVPEETFETTAEDLTTNDAWDCRTPRTAPPVTPLYPPTNQISTPSPRSCFSPPQTVSPLSTPGGPNHKLRPIQCSVNVIECDRDSPCDFLDNNLCMTPTLPTDASTEETENSEDVDIVTSEITYEDELEMQLVVKNLDTGAVTLLDSAPLSLDLHNHTKIREDHTQDSHVSRGSLPIQVETATCNIARRMVRNLDTGEILLLSSPAATKPKKRAKFARFWGCSAIVQQAQGGAAEP